jgi:hypothetical protein
MNDILFPIIEHYIGTSVSGIRRDDELVLFKTSAGRGGRIEKNLYGDWDLLVGNEKVCEIEDVLFSIFCDYESQPPIDKYYKKLLKLKSVGTLNQRSNVLVDQLMFSIEFLIMNMEVNLEEPIKIGPFLAFSHSGKKHVLGLN